jgi:hypothetical protein
MKAVLYYIHIREVKEDDLLSDSSVKVNNN